MNLPKLALFDLDHTLLPIDSDYSWGQFTAARGWTDLVEFTRHNDAFYTQYKAGTLDIYEYARFATAAFVRQGEVMSLAAHADYMRTIVQPALKPQAIQLVQQHKDAGATVIVVTATNEFVTRPIAQALGADELMAVDLERDTTPGGSGWFTGEVRGIPSFREGKVLRVEAWLAARGMGWGDVHSTFYSDSINDLPLLEKANVPVATNPDDPLRAIAQARGWRILELFN
jgi:HAD superfamily hydrolase (TIGR01490 family)